MFVNTRNLLQELAALLNFEDSPKCRSSIAGRRTTVAGGTQTPTSARPYISTPSNLCGDTKSNGEQIKSWHFTSGRANCSLTVSRMQLWWNKHFYLAITIILTVCSQSTCACSFQVLHMTAKFCLRENFNQHCINSRQMVHTHS